MSLAENKRVFRVVNAIMVERGLSQPTDEVYREAWRFLAKLDAALNCHSDQEKPPDA